ncbi:MAG TPA: glycosyltransferase [Caulobacteraceae bacterium]|jgi:glycosyltransferase involved in cell wall biosynthesis
MKAVQLLGSAKDGGAETYFLSLVETLQAHGMPEACALRPHAGRVRRVQDLGVPVVEAGFGGPLDLMTAGRIKRFARKEDAGALIAWMNRAARHTPRGPWARIGRLGGYYGLKYYRGFDHLVANTRDIERWIVRRGWPAGKVSYIPNFAEPGAGAPIDRALHDTPADAPLLLGMGRLHASKAHDISIRALAELPGAYLWIAGSGPLEGELKALADQVGVSDRVRFLGWRDDAPSLYRTADACLFPSRFEPLGNVIIQAWAHGLPVVAAMSDGPAALIRPEQDGILVPINDVRALAMAARRLILNVGLRQHLAEAGETRVREEFSAGHVVDKWRELLEPYGVG